MKAHCYEVRTEYGNVICRTARLAYAVKRAKEYGNKYRAAFVETVDPPQTLFSSTRNASIDPHAPGTAPLTGETT